MTADELRLAATALDRRLVLSGVADLRVLVHTVGAQSTITVIWSGRPADSVIRLATSRGLVAFRTVLLSGPPAPTTTPGGAPSGPWTASTQARFDALDCTHPVDVSPPAPPADDLVTCASDGAEKYLLGPVVVDETELTQASAGQQTTSTGIGAGEWVVDMTLDGHGTAVFSELTARLAAATPGGDANRFAIVLDGLSISAPQVMGVISDGKPQLAGGFTRQSALDLAAELASGPLPVGLQVVGRSTVTLTP